MWKERQCQVLFLLVASFGVIVFALYEGDECLHQRQNKSGICRPLESCETALTDLKQNKIYPENCGFVGKIIIVCCVPAEETTAATTTTAPTTTTSSTTTTTTATTTTNATPKEKRRVGEISRQKCTEYKALSYKEELSPILIDDADMEITDICPWEQEPQIISGTQTTRGEFSHMALLKYTSRLRCGGSLISEKFVLTAAHCITEKAKPLSVRLGDLNLIESEDDQDVQEINIKRIHVHPLYNEPIQYNDIALLELQEPVKLSVFLKPACLYTKKDLSVRQALVTGWGLTEEHVFSDHLLKTVLDLFPEEACSPKFNHITQVFPKGVDYNLSVCAGSFQGANDTCGGDSGGPLQIYSTDVHCSYYIIGITSFGLRCGQVNSPAVYTKVYPYLEWIEGIVWPE